MVALVVFRAVFTSTVSAQDEDAIALKSGRLKRCIDGFERSRANVGTYCVKIVEVNYSRNVKIFSEDGAGQIPFSSLQTRVTEILAEPVSDRYLMTTTSDPVLPFSALSGGASYLIDGLSFRELAPSGEFQEVPIERISIGNPLTLGAGFCAQINRFYPFQEVSAGLHTWHQSPTNWLMENRAAKVIFRIPSPKNADSRNSPRDKMLISFNRNCDYLIQDLTAYQGSSHVVSARVKPVLVNGIWLPGEVMYFCGDNTLTWKKLDWVMVNEPVVPLAFEASMLERLAQVHAHVRGNVKHAAEGFSLPELIHNPDAPSLELCKTLLHRQVKKAILVDERALKRIEEIALEILGKAPSIDGLRKDWDLEAGFQPLITESKNRDSEVWGVLEEALTPAQMDRLMGAYLAFYGLQGTLNARVAERLGIDDERQSTLRNEMRKARDNTRAWVKSGGKASEGEDDQLWGSEIAPQLLTELQQQRLNQLLAPWTTTASTRTIMVGL